LLFLITNYYNLDVLAFGDLEIIEEVPLVFR